MLVTAKENNSKKTEDDKEQDLLSQSKDVRTRCESWCYGSGESWTFLCACQCSGCASSLAGVSK